MTLTDKLKAILAEAEKATPVDTFQQDTLSGLLTKLEPTPGNLAFIASARTNVPSMAKALLIAVEWIKATEGKVCPTIKDDYVTPENVLAEMEKLLK